MSNPKLIIISESEKELKKQLKSCSIFFRPRLLMLIELKKNKKYGISKRDLADLIGVNHNSIQNWRNLYEKEGLIGIMSHNRTGFKPSVITKEEHKGLKDILSDPSSGIQGYKELKFWFEDKYNRTIAYSTITGYCIRHFKSKIKVARKSHVKKDEEAGECFKKTLISTCLKSLS